jgi:hypothetical protein
MGNLSQPSRIPPPSSEGEELFALHCSIYHIDVVREFRFHPLRKWRFDFFAAPNVGIEIEGGTWIQGRHSRGPGYQRDLEKYNAAALLGILVFRFTTGMVVSGEAIDTVRAALTPAVKANGPFEPSAV